jgi:BirA family transcriptional regulator, biotin operon repressor / biotin---[acetyl-CoA-carboxylase] ligase
MSGRTTFGEVRRFSELDSTNRYLADEARAGAPEGLVVMADHQSAGRGRLGRKWEAPAGANLLVSVLLRPVLALEELHLCTVAMALAARSAISSATSSATGVEPGLKWPNDLMVRERKLAGILAESLPASAPSTAAPSPDTPPPGPSDGRSPRTVVVGIGVNVGWPAPDDEAGAVPVPADLAHATSVWRESGIKVEPADLLEVLLDELEIRYLDLGGAEGRRRLASDYRSACTTLGQTVSVSLADAKVTGSVVDISAEGHLLLDVGACIRTITAGDVVHLRPSATTHLRP